MPDITKHSSVQGLTLELQEILTRLHARVEALEAKIVAEAEKIVEPVPEPETPEAVDPEVAPDQQTAATPTA
ncbi:MAG: hypothetical protein ACYC9L_17420 [Sulfuricaulis sp.]